MSNVTCFKKYLLIIFINIPKFILQKKFISYKMPLTYTHAHIFIELYKML